MKSAMSKLKRILLIALMLFLCAGAAGTLHAHAKMLEPDWSKAMMVGTFVGFWFALMGSVVVSMMLPEGEKKS